MKKYKIKEKDENMEIWKADPQLLENYWKTNGLIGVFTMVGGQKLGKDEKVWKDMILKVPKLVSICSNYGK